MLKLADRLDGKSRSVVVFGMTTVLVAWLFSDVNGLAAGKAIAKLAGTTAAYSVAFVMTLRIAREHRQVCSTASRRNVGMREFHDSA